MPSLCHQQFLLLGDKAHVSEQLAKVGEDSMVVESQTHIHGVANPMA